MGQALKSFDAKYTEGHVFTANENQETSHHPSVVLIWFCSALTQPLTVLADLALQGVISWILLSFINHAFIVNGLFQAKTFDVSVFKGPRDINSPVFHSKCSFTPLHFVPLYWPPLS